MGWANRITVLRSLLMIGVWVLLLTGTPYPPSGYWYAAFVLFVITAVTDLVDGWVARHFGDVSVFGRIADPLVDKLMILGTMVVLLPLDGVSSVMPAWAVVIILSREVIVTALRGAVEGQGVSFQAMPIGKVKMLSQSFAVGGVILWGAGFWLPRWAIPGLTDLFGPRFDLAHTLVWVSVLLTAVSGVDYAIRATRILSRG